MGKRQRTRKAAAAARAHEVQSAVYPPLMLGSFSVPKFDTLRAVFGARFSDYPPMDLIPAEFHRHSGRFQDVFAQLFYRGGKLADHGLRLKSGLDHAAAMTAIRAYMSSFDPKHEHKTATVAWALSEWCEEIA